MSEAQAQEWLRTANQDAKWAQVSLDAGLNPQACFASQQAAEKALKAFLILKTGAYPRIHSLPDLLDLAVAHGDLAEVRLQCQILDKFYTPTRYPGADFGAVFTHAAAQRAIQAGRDILDTVRKLIEQESA